MRLVNWIARGIGYIGVYLLVLIECFLMSVVVTGSLVSVVLCGLTMFGNPLPVIFVSSFWKAFLFSCIPLTFIFFVIVTFHIIDLYHDIKIKIKKRREEKKKAKEENR